MRPKRNPDPVCGCTRMEEEGPCPGIEPVPGVVEGTRSDQAHPDAVPVGKSGAAPVVPPGDLGRCRSCGAAIRWVVTAGGKRMPLDAEPDPSRGNVRLHADGSTESLTRGAVDSAQIDREPLYLSHFATCPGAAKHRRK